MPGEMHERSSERRANRKHGQRMAGRQRADAIPPILKRPVRLIRTQRRRIENHMLAATRSDGLARQNENVAPCDGMPSSPRDHCYAAFDAGPR